MAREVVDFQCFTAPLSPAGARGAEPLKSAQELRQACLASLAPETNQPRALPLISQVSVARITAESAVVVGSSQPTARGQQKAPTTAPKTKGEQNSRFGRQDGPSTVIDIYGDVSHNEPSSIPVIPEKAAIQYLLIPRTRAIAGCTPARAGHMGTGLLDDDRNTSP